MTIAICDDEKKECERIKEKVDNIPGLKRMNYTVNVYEPDEFANMVSLLEGIPEENSESFLTDEPDRPDLVIMDIEFLGKDYDGIDLIKRLNKVSRNTQIIYLTHILEFAPEVYDTDHCYFVMKNNMDIMLEKAFDKALDIYTAVQKQRPLEIMCEGHKMFVLQTDIRYIEKLQRQTVIHTDSSSFACYDSITSMCRKLSDNIIRCHGGYLVNLSHITYMGGDKIVLDVPDTEIPIGKTYKEQTKQAYLKYWMKRM